MYLKHFLEDVGVFDATFAETILILYVWLSLVRPPNIVTDPLSSFYVAIQNMF